MKVWPANSYKTIYAYTYYVYVYIYIDVCITACKSMSTRPYQLSKSYLNIQGHIVVCRQCVVWYGFLAVMMPLSTMLNASNFTCSIMSIISLIYNVCSATFHVFTISLNIPFLMEMWFRALLSLYCNFMIDTPGTLVACIFPEDV